MYNRDSTDKLSTIINGIQEFFRKLSHRKWWQISVRTIYKLREKYVTFFRLKTFNACSTHWPEKCRYRYLIILYSLYDRVGLIYITKRWSKSKESRRNNYRWSIPKSDVKSATNLFQIYTSALILYELTPASLTACSRLGALIWYEPHLTPPH